MEDDPGCGEGTDRDGEPGSGTESHENGDGDWMREEDSDEDDVWILHIETTGLAREDPERSARIMIHRGGGPGRRRWEPDGQSG